MMLLPLSLLSIIFGTVNSAGRDGIDFIYFNGNSTDGAGVILPGTGAKMESWSKQKNTFGVTVQRIILDQNGEVGNGHEFFINGDSYLIVTKGEAIFGTKIAEGMPIELGDMVWVAGGATFGPIINIAEAETIILSISSSVFSPDFSPSLNSNPTTVLEETIQVWRHQDVGHRYKSVNGYPLADRVDWKAGDFLRPHYHPRGSFYIPLDSCQDLIYGGDREELVKITAGDVRWVRPGYFYTTERTENGCLFIALHESQASWVTNTKQDAWVSWEKFQGEYQCQYESVQTVVFGSQE